MVTLYDKARARGALTIGIGDGGNEIGWASSETSLKKRCPSGTGAVVDAGGASGTAPLLM